MRNPALDEDPLRPSKEQAALDRARKETMRQNEIRAQLGQERLPMPSGVPAPQINSSGVSVAYVYEVNLSNTGDKAIKSLVWDYVLFDREARLEVGRHRFLHESGIRPGKSKKLAGHSTSPPAFVVDVKKSGKQSRGQFEESVVIQRIVYADGSAWERPSN